MLYYSSRLVLKTLLNSTILKPLFCSAMVLCSIYLRRVDNSPPFSSSSQVSHLTTSSVLRHLFLEGAIVLEGLHGSLRHDKNFFQILLWNFSHLALLINNNFYVRVLLSKLESGKSLKRKQFVVSHYCYALQSTLAIIFYHSNFKKICKREVIMAAMKRDAKHYSRQFKRALLAKLRQSQNINNNEEFTEGLDEISLNQDDARSLVIDITNEHDTMITDQPTAPTKHHHNDPLVVNDQMLEDNTKKQWNYIEENFEFDYAAGIKWALRTLGDRWKAYKYSLWNIYFYPNKIKEKKILTTKIDSNIPPIEWTAFVHHYTNPKTKVIT
ncbi:hypothetical protein Ahy_B03g064751 [Arachis hypogaea]|uniref:Uncharacterized protein n=1 Tax=Arachis hypogaea TaxID=3818 RepID=A0A445A0A1_ARAHY|nr:hypothetical protein Ahy_B03g064751 [Arachis hypogaea]